MIFESANSDLTLAIHQLTHAIRDASQHNFVTKHDLQQLEQHILMKLSEIKTQVAAAAARSTEAFSEIGSRIASLQTQIQELLDAATDPDVTDAEFIASLNTLKSNTDQLADIVPNPQPPVSG